MIDCKAQGSHSPIVIGEMYKEGYFNNSEDRFDYRTVYQIECEHCGKTAIKYSDDDEIVWNDGTSNYSNCDLCGGEEERTNLMGFYEFYVCSKCSSLYTDEDLQKELEHESVFGELWKRREENE